MVHQQHGLRFSVLALLVVGAHGFWFSEFSFWWENFLDNLFRPLDVGFFDRWACIIQGVIFGCVWNERQLRQQVQLYESGILSTCRPPIDDLGSFYGTRIDICATEITLSEPLDFSNGVEPIEIVGDLGGGTSTLSGGGSTRILQASFPETGGPSMSFRLLTFKDGRADNGGLVFFTGSLAWRGVRFRFCTFEGGAATEAGGAVFLSGDGSFGFESTRFISNTAQNGGALYIENSRVDIRSGEFVSNAATGNGGAIFADGARVDMGLYSTVAFKSNLATGNGGAIFADGASVDMKTAAFKSNLADGNGADVYIADDEDPGLADPPDFQAEGPGSYVDCEPYNPDFSYCCGVFFCDSADTDIADLLTEQGAGVNGNQLYSNTNCFENTDLSLDTVGRCDAL